MENNVLEKTTSDEIYAQTVKLPSLGILYPATHPLHGVSEIEIRPMTTYEEDILTSRNLIKKGTVVDTLIKSCLIDKSIEPQSMFGFDRNAVLVAIRAISYGADYTVKLECPDAECKRKFKHSFDLSQLPVTYYDSKYGSNNEFDFVLPSNGKVIKFKFLTAQDENNIMESAKASKRDISTSDISNIVSTKWIQQITEFDKKTDKIAISVEVRKMLASDSSALRNYIESITPGLDLSYEIECPGCETVFDLSMPIEREFFWPGR